MKSKNSVLRSARKYIDLGWCVVPIPAKEKAPRLKKWQKLRIKKSQVPENFEEGDNVGVLLGKPSGGLVDVDLDCPEALALADSFLPKTDCLFGRKSNPRSHRLYLCDPPPAPEKFNDPEAADPEDACLLELRSTGQQTIVPPSIHPSCERVRWVEKGNPPRTKPGELRKAAARLAAASLLARKWRKGRRNETALALAGMLLRAGWNEDEAAEFIESVAEAANDEEWEKRGAAVEATQKKLDSGKQVTGIPKLVELLGEKTVNSVCEWLSIGKKALKEQVATVDELLEDADSLPEIHPSQAFHDGVFWYGLPLGEEKIWVNSRGEFFTLEEMRIHFSLPVSPTISRWSLSSVKRFRAGKTNVDVGALFLELRYFISRRIHFVASWQPTVVTLWIMGTYVYRVFDWFGYLWLTSPGRRTGKTRLLEIISAFAYNATSVMTDPTEASLFRETAFNASTQILDEVESLRAGDQEKKAALMSMLNAGFKSRSKVPRFNLSMNRIEYHDAFCPRVLAGISRLAPTLVDRCLKVFLKRKLKEEKVARFSERKLSKYLQHQRNLLYKFGLRCAPSIAKQYEAADSFPIPKAVDDRARDILEPLFAIATVLDEQNQKLKITEQLIYAAERIAKDRAADEGEDEEVVAALQALAEKFPKSSDHWILTSVEAQSHFHRHDALEWVENRRQAARLLRQLGFKSAPHRQWTDVVRGYRIERHKLTDLCERYGVEPPKRKRG